MVREMKIGDRSAGGVGGGGGGRALTETFG